MSKANTYEIQAAVREHRAKKRQSNAANVGSAIVMIQDEIARLNTLVAKLHEVDLDDDDEVKRLYKEVRS